MALNLSDFITEHRFIVLLDIRGYSELPDDQQLEAIKTVTNESLKVIEDGGYKTEKIFSSFIPTGDGFYIIGDERNSLFWSQLCLVFALSLRNALMDSFDLLKFECKGVTVAVHFGTTLSFTDIADHINYVGRGMNETARLLSPINKAEISNIKKNFYGHENSVVISKVAFEKMEYLPDIGIRISDPFTLFAKHDKKFECRFIDLPKGEDIKILSF